jgi:hypothetical protein
MGCSLKNLGSCLVEQFFEFFLDILNYPIKYLLRYIEDLFTDPVKISAFADIWAIIVYVLSMFYGLLFMYIGFKFMVSGENPEQREQAKIILRNSLIMMILIQASYHLYDLILEIFSGLTKAVFRMIGSNFFTLTHDSFANIGLEITLLIPYLMVLVLTLIIMVIRYICVSAGVVFFALGIFFYFIPFLHHYGKLILNGLLVLISMPFFYSLILLISSELTHVGIFRNMKILIMIGSFSLIILFTLLLGLFVIAKAAMTISKPIGAVSKIVKLMG